jgi:glycosyltransferase involved in cell wall biosynthesis
VRPYRGGAPKSIGAPALCLSSPDAEASGAARSFVRRCAISRKLILFANQAWNLVNYRAGLIRALREDGFELVAVAPPESRSEERLAAMGCRFVPIELSAKSLSPLGEIRTFAQLRGILRREKPAALLTWTIKANLWGGLAARIAGIPVVPNVSRGAVRAEQARVLAGSGVDLARFKPADPLVRPLQRRFLLSARLLGAKGVREFVVAAELLKPAFPDVEFALLGFTDVAAADAITRAEVDRWAASETVAYYEPVEDVRPFLESADAIVLPSYYREGLSRALLEAAAMGRPVVTTDHPGCREAIVDGVTGFLCAPRDAFSLAEAMRKIAEMGDADWIAMATAARRRAEEEFSEQRIVAEYRAALAREGVA